jgi:hypothetical protein
MNQQLSQERGKNMSHLSEEKLDELIARESERQLPPLNDWRTIAARAREEGLIRESSSRGWLSGQPWIQAAAAVLLLIGGIAIGRATIGLPSAIQSSAGNTTAAATGAIAPSISTPSNASFASVDEASATLKRAVADYQLASEYLASGSSVRSRDSLTIYSARAAALDKIVDATENALQSAPQDPVLNQYYLATMGARAATQQLVARPVALRGF